VNAANPVLTLAEIEATRDQLAEHILTTPVHHWQGPQINKIVGEDTQVILKLELFQKTGTFKVRGALAVMLELGPEVLARGVTAVSAGNHAIATAYAAQVVGTTAKVVMMKNANSLRVEKCKAFGAEVILAEDVHEAFDTVARIEKEEGRTFVHPFEGPLTARGTATLGMEFLEQWPDLDAVIVPIGGGGLCAGAAAAVKLLRPECPVFGVEPEGADNMHRSFEAGSPQAIDRVTTIADSLGPPKSLPYSFALCRDNVDDLVLIDDDAMRKAMRLLFREMKLAVEPAGAAATAALCGPLLGRLRGKKVGVIVCGTNIDAESFARHLKDAN
jgi:threonine dehydratase